MKNPLKRHIVIVRIAALVILFDERLRSRGFVEVNHP
jgi:hypothetical protein